MLDLEPWPWAGQGVRGLIDVEDPIALIPLPSARCNRRTIARRLGIARNTVREALRSEGPGGPPRYERAAQGSAVDAFEPAIRDLLREFPKMPASVVAERVGWEARAPVLRVLVASGSGCGGCPS